MSDGEATGVPGSGDSIVAGLMTDGPLDPSLRVYEPWQAPPEVPEGWPMRGPVGECECRQWAHTDIDTLLQTGHHQLCRRSDQLF